ncbi:hypothetical protein [Streptomyces sp. NPDC049970]|uniref:hypothetical protein n=1 Tax=Streptomyces sp. NPDC049970 TaxID=3155033 RepID=UPI003427BA23
MLEVDLSLTSVAVHAVTVGELVHGSIHSGADRVADLPVECLLPTMRLLSQKVAHWARAGQG